MILGVDVVMEHAEEATSSTLTVAIVGSYCKIALRSEDFQIEYRQNVPPHVELSQYMSVAQLDDFIDGLKKARNLLQQQLPPLDG